MILYELILILILILILVRILILWSPPNVKLLDPERVPQEEFPRKGPPGRVWDMRPLIPPSPVNKTTFIYKTCTFESLFIKRVLWESTLGVYSRSLLSILSTGMKKRNQFGPRNANGCRVASIHGKFSLGQPILDLDGHSPVL